MPVQELSMPEDGDSQSDPLGGLLQRIALQDRLAFHEFYLYASPRLYGIALGLARDRQAAGEALQETMLQIWQRAYRFDPARGSAEAWITGILRLRTLDILASATRRRPANNQVDQEVDLPDEAALERLENTASGLRLRRCLSELEHKNRQSVILAYVHGYSHSEIARRMDIPLGTAKAWIRRGIAVLKTCFGSQA